MEPTVPIPDNDCYEQNYAKTALEACLGTNLDRRHNFFFIEPTIYIHFSGFTYHLTNLVTGECKTFSSLNGGGIGAIAVNRSKKILAIGEKGKNPNIYLYSMPEHKEFSILRGGTERGYSFLCFSRNSDKLISVGNFPDFSIVLWNWASGQVLLRAKAFSQEIYAVRFSDTSDDIICTAGMAHIKFWKIANTFTGLKQKARSASSVLSSFPI